MKKDKLQNLTSYPRVASEPTSPSPISVKVPISQHKAWMSLPVEERNTYLRQAIEQKLVEKKLISA